MAKPAKVEWVVVCQDGTQLPANNFIFSDAAFAAAEHGGVRCMALVEILE